MGLENFDGVGLWRDTESGRPVDASGDVVGLKPDGKFTGAMGLAKKLAVLEPSPADLLHSAYLVPCELLPQLPRQRLVKQYAHRP
jgi:hypothetical protein